jgi:hypothetical protein
VTANHAPPPIRELPPNRLAELKDNLVHELDGRPTRLFARPVFAVVVALMLLIAVGGWLGTRAGTETASAAEVRAKLAEGLRFSQSISGEYSVQTRDPGPRPRGVRGCVNCTPGVPVPSKFVIGVDGSYSSLTLPLDAPTRNDVAYDSGTGVETSMTVFSGRRLYIRATNLDPASPKWTPAAQLGIWVQGLVASKSPRIKNTTFDGRPAWKLTITLTPGTWLWTNNGARVDVVVDQATGLVLEVTRYAYSTHRWTSIERIHDLKIGEPTSDADFTVPKQPGAPERALDYGFRRVPLADAEAIVGYQPLLPSNTLGRSLRDFAVAKLSNPLPDVPGAPTGRDVVSAR